METEIAGKTAGNIIKNNYRAVGSVLIFVFLTMNALKITVFNIFMMNPITLQEFLHKLGVTFLLAAGIYIVILGARSRLLFMLFYILQGIYIFVNLVYYMYFHTYLHISQAVALLSEGIGAAGDLSVLISPKLLIALADLPAAIYLLFVYPKLSEVFGRRQLLNRLSLAFLCLFIIAAMEGWNYLHQYSIFDIAKDNSQVGESLTVQRYGTFANSLVVMASNRNDSSLISRLSYGQHLSSSGKNTARPNFVVIQVESMDANAINKQHNGQYVMPFLHSLSQQSVYYPYTMSYHEAGATSDCEFSTINSVEPLDDYPSIKIGDYFYPNSIVRQLEKNLYSTIAFHGNVGSYFNRDVAYPKMGYQKLVDMTEMNLKDVGWGAPDSDVFKFAENRLKSEKEPFFAYTITMTSHGPFTNANNYYNNSNYDDVQDKTARDYMNSMSYVDQSIGDYVNYIRANFKNTYIFIWGDHTPNVNNNDYKQASFTDEGRYYEFVPLMIVTPDNKTYKENNIAASFLDVAPTIANASGMPYSINSDGIDLLNRSGDAPKIPFKGGIADRSYLFDKVSKIN
jgi:phosphoglycerol transferase MdoB-like AlkP superfamily enzyme